MPSLHAAPATPNPGPVSYTLVLTVAARRLASRMHVDAKQLTTLAVDAYRRTWNPHDGKRALYDAPQRMRRPGGDTPGAAA